MSNLKLNNSLFDFFKKNKAKICAIGMIGVMSFNLVACGSSATDNKDYNSNYNTTTQSETTGEKIWITNIKNNIDNISVSKDLENSNYILLETQYFEIPYYEMNDNGDLFVSHIDKQVLDTVQYKISFDEADEYNLTELLESKVNNNQKIK